MLNKEFNVAINDRLAQYKGKKVAINYSAGFDSSVLAWHLLNTFEAEEVALVMFDCGAENKHLDHFSDNTKPEDLVEDIWQFERYANLLNTVNAFGTGKQFKLWRVKTPNLNALTVEPHNLAPPDNWQAENDENNHGLTFYAGFVMLRLATGLSVAAKFGYDYVLTGHMNWNGHYKDESQEFAKAMNDIFYAAYGSRLKKAPRVEMPFRDIRIDKADLIRFNDSQKNKLNPLFTISCNVSALESEEDTKRVTNFKIKTMRLVGPFNFDVQIHCGKCQHCLDRLAQFANAGVEDTAFYDAANE